MLGKLRNVTLARQFMLASFVVLLAGMLIIGWWISGQIERGVINQTAGVTALYVDSFITPHLQDLARGNLLDAEHRSALDKLMTTTPLGKRIVAFKVWSRDGEILYSTSASLIGRRFPIGFGLQHALDGQVASHISNLKQPENEEESKRWLQLLETYAPVRLAGTEHIFFVSEFYQTVDDLSREIQIAQMTSWIVIGVCTTLMYLLLAGMVGRGSRTIARQQRDLAEMNERVRRAAARTTALNEQFLRRISADLHDGPGQDLSFALLRLYTIAEHCRQCLNPAKQQSVSAELDAIQNSLQSGLGELRDISAGLRLPELDALSPTETVARAIHEHASKTNTHVEFTAERAPDRAPMPVKITLFRLTQEALANSYRHARGARQAVRVWSDGAVICLEVADTGRGFDQQSISPGTQHLGLAGMRERVQVLGGTFEVESAPGAGTRIRARVPQEVSDE
ncbi:MAG: sensor histidine kinase [Chloroflexi bacterium]|nr:sensor histidine kinase [Chloroflexota bacterium]